jgi:probable HAF family extracellular repeat protein
MEVHMRPATLSCISAIALSASLLLPAPLTAEEHRHEAPPPRYKLIDLGTLGGPLTYGSASGDGARLLNDRGEVSSYADTDLPDPFAPDHCWDADCLLAHAFRWRHGKITDLGGLDDDFNSVGDSINDRGWVTGFAQTGFTDPAFGFLVHAVLWRDRKAVDLGTLPGGSVSLGISVKNTGQVVGFSDNGVPDPFASFFFPSPNQVRTFDWHGDELEDIGTLGGPDAVPGEICSNQRRGVIVGSSYVNFTPNTSSGQPTIDPFLWDNGVMTDLGNLGGTFNFGQCINNRGEVIGNSNLPGDQTFHAYRWRNGKMKDLGTLGGPDSEAIWINDAGDIAGSADLPTPGVHDAVVWRHGHIKDLGTLPGDACSRGRGINYRGQVVGGSSDCRNFLHAFVWEEGGPMRNLNKLIAPGSGLEITNAFNINDRGEILAKSFPIGTTPNDDEDLGHLVLLIPCDKDDHEGECSDRERPDDAVASPVSASPTSRLAIAPPSPHSLTAEDGNAAWRARLAHRFGAPDAMRK